MGCGRRRWRQRRRAGTAGADRLGRQGCCCCSRGAEGEAQPEPDLGGFITPWEDVPAGKRHGLRVAIAAAECVIECHQRVTVNQKEVLLLSP